MTGRNMYRKSDNAESNIQKIISIASTDNFLDRILEKVKQRFLTSKPSPEHAFAHLNSTLFMYLFLKLENNNGLLNLKTTDVAIIGKKSLQIKINNQVIRIKCEIEVIKAIELYLSLHKEFVHLKSNWFFRKVEWHAFKFKILDEEPVQKYFNNHLKNFLLQNNFFDYSLSEITLIKFYQTAITNPTIHHFINTGLKHGYSIDLTIQWARYFVTIQQGQLKYEKLFENRHEVAYSRPYISVYLEKLINSSQSLNYVEDSSVLSAMANPYRLFTDVRNKLLASFYIYLPIQPATLLNLKDEDIIQEGQDYFVRMTHKCSSYRHQVLLPKEVSSQIDLYRLVKKGAEKYLGSSTDYFFASRGKTNSTFSRFNDSAASQKIRKVFKAWGIEELNWLEFQMLYLHNKLKSDPSLQSFFDITFELNLTVSVNTRNYVAVRSISNKMMVNNVGVNSGT